MNITAMNVKITFQKNDAVIDKIGNHTNSWKYYYSCFATVSGENGSEQEVVGETVENVQICFTVRYCRKIADVSSTKFRIIFNDEPYNIISIDHFSYKKQVVKFKCQKARR